MPPPEPRSRTVSPGRRSATATGFPQPRLAETALSGRSARSPGVYRPWPKGVFASSPQQPMLSQSHPQPHPLPDVWARLVAASA